MNTTQTKSTADSDREVMDLISLGKDNAEIAMITGLSERQVKRSVGRLQSKLNAYRRPLMVRRAFQRGFLALN